MANTLMYLEAANEQILRCTNSGGKPLHILKMFMTLKAVYNIGYLTGSDILNFECLVYTKIIVPWIGQTRLSLASSHPFKDYVRHKTFRMSH